MKIVLIYFLFTLVTTLLFVLEGKDWGNAWYFSFNDFLELYIFCSFLVLVGIVVFYTLDYLGFSERNIIVFALIYLLIVSVIQIFGVMLIGDILGILE